MSAQTITGQAYVQQTVMGIQKGFSLRIQNKAGWGIGMIHQSGLKSTQEEPNEKYPFHGLELIVPLTKSGKMQLFFAPKIGYVNNYFFVLIPEVETELKISERISVSITAGIRAREASTGFKILLHLLANK